LLLACKRLLPTLRVPSKVASVRGMHQPEKPRHEVELRGPGTFPAPRAGERFQDELVSAVPAGHEHASVPAKPWQGGGEIGRHKSVVGVHVAQTAVYPAPGRNGSTDQRRHLQKAAGNIAAAKGVNC
jgi:hypothetical protein